MNGCLETQFELQKIKILKEASGVEIEFKVIGGDTVPTIMHLVENPQYPHPDMLKAIESLKDLLIEAVGHKEGENDKITVTGIAVSGFDANKGAIITGTYLCKNGSKIAINSPRIRYEGEQFGFEGELSEICQRVETEAYLYTFKDKQAQQQIIFEEDAETH